MDVLEADQILGFFTTKPKHRKTLVLQLGVECNSACGTAVTLFLVTVTDNIHINIFTACK